MVLSQPDLRTAVERGDIEFDPPLEESQWGEASVDLRLGFSFTKLRPLDGMKVSVARGLAGVGAAGFWKTIELQERNQLDKRETYDLEPGEFVLCLTHESVTVPRNMIAPRPGATSTTVSIPRTRTCPPIPVVAGEVGGRSPGRGVGWGGIEARSDCRRW